jgi:hypothetical protein
MSAFDPKRTSVAILCYDAIWQSAFGDVGLHARPEARLGASFHDTHVALVTPS